MSGESVAQDELRGFVDRIIRLKEEVAAVNSDIRDVYAEAKGNGFDKTVLGKLVTYVQKRSENSSEVAEAEAVFDLYVSAYYGSSASHTHASAREDADPLPEHDAETGEIIEPQGATPAQTEPGFDEVHPSVSLAFTPSDRTGAVADGHQIQPETAPQSTAARMDVRDNSTEDAPAPVNLDPASATTMPAEFIRPVDTLSPLTGDATEAGEEDAPTPSPVTGEVWHEETHKTPVKRHAFSLAFGELSKRDRDQLQIDIYRAHGGVKKPIVWIGNIILDGWQRYIISRELLIPYPCIEYTGADALADVIRWNLESRTLDAAARKQIASKLKRLPECAGREHDIASLLGLEAEEGAAA